MLNLFKNLFNTKKENHIKKLSKSKKHFPSSVREWNNSIYVFNKNVLNNIPTASNVATKLINSYFYIYNFKLERKLRIKRLLLRLRRLSSNRIYVSNGEFKHTNNNVIITLYILNKQKSNFFIALKKSYRKAIFLYKGKLENKVKLIKNKSLNFLINLNVNNSSKLNLNNKKTYVYLDKYYNKLIKKSLFKLKMYFYYRQLIYINRSKFNYTYLQYLKIYLEKIFNKNIEFNLVNIKRFYLNSDILSESITLKLKKNRRKILRYLKTMKKKINPNKIIMYESNKNILNKEMYFLKRKHIEKIIFNNLKYKHITGFRLEAAGRLTRRYTASRTTSKIIYLGNLVNIDSTYKGLSSVLLKGNLKSNIQHTKLKSKSRIGSFGIKGWVSGN